MIRGLAFIVCLLLTSSTYAQCGDPSCVMCYGSSAYRHYQPQWQQPQWQPPVRVVRQASPRPSIKATPQPIVDEMLRLANLTTEDVVYDLGCGDGRIVKTAAKRWGCYGRGIEIDPQVAAYARQNCSGLSTVRIIEGDARQYNLRRNCVVTMYLDQDLIRELVPKIRVARLVVSRSHPVPGMRNRRVLVGGQYPVYLAYPASTQKNAVVARGRWTTLPSPGSLD